MTLHHWHVTQCRCTNPHGYHLHEANGACLGGTCLSLAEFLRPEPKPDETHPDTMIGRRAGQPREKETT